MLTSSPFSLNNDHHFHFLIVQTSTATLHFASFDQWTLVEAAAEQYSVFLVLVDFVDGCHHHHHRQHCQLASHPCLFFGISPLLVFLQPSLTCCFILILFS